MVGWHPRLVGHEFGQTVGDGGGLGSLACCSPTGWQRVGRDLVTERGQYCRITVGTKEVLKGECSSFLLSLSLCVSKEPRSLCTSLSFPIGKGTRYPL